MSYEATEMAGVAEADTEMAYAWGALDYDDADEFPTQRLTPRRITSLGIAASLVVIAVAGAVALGVLHHTNQPVAQATSTSVANTVVTPTPPEAVTTPPPVTVTASAPVLDHAREESFMAALNGTPFDGPTHVSYATIPGSHGAYMGDVSAWTVGGPVVKYGYQACAVLNRYPNEFERATVAFFEDELGADPPTLASPGFEAQVKQERLTYMRIAGTYLC
jgi:hypothetical protein